MLVTEVVNLPRHRRVALLGVGAQMQRVLLHQIQLQAGLTGVVQVLLAGSTLRFERTDNGVLALVERSLAGLLHAEIDQHLIVRCRTEALDARIVQPGLVQLLPDMVEVRRLRELHIDQRAAAKLHAQRNVVPEQHGTDSGDAEDQREGEKVPLLAQEIDIGIAK